MTKQNTPKVRFVGFRDDWNNRYLVDIIESQVKGKAKLDKLLEGEVAYLDASYLNGGEVFYTNGVKDVQYDDILIMWDGSNAGKVFTGFSGSLGSTLKGYRLEQGQNSSFVYQYLVKNQSKIYECYRTPNIPHVVKNFTKIFPISLPSKSEQSQIGSLFSTIDSLLSFYKDNLENYQAFKKSMLSKMFPRAGQTVPEIRLDGFEGEWEQIKMGKIFTQQVDYIEPNENNELWSLTVEKGLTPKTDRYKRDFLVKKTDKFKRVKPNDFAYNPMNLTLGSLDANQLGKSISVSGYYVIMSIEDQSKYDIDYFKILLKTSFAIFQYKQYATGSLIEKQRVQFPTFSEIPFAIPSLPEQRAIGSFFSNLDDLISSYQAKIDELESLKKKLLQDMFI